MTPWWFSKKCRHFRLPFIPIVFFITEKILIYHFDGNGWRQAFSLLTWLPCSQRHSASRPVRIGTCSFRRSRFRWRGRSNVDAASFRHIAFGCVSPLFSIAFWKDWAEWTPCRPRVSNGTEYVPPRLWRLALNLHVTSVARWPIAVCRCREWILTPITMSWICDEAIEKAIARALIAPITKLWTSRLDLAKRRLTNNTT